MTKTGNQIEFEPMLGPAEDYPPDLPEWAERISNRLQLATELITRHTVRHLKDLLAQIWEAQPWKIWPKGAPFETPNDYCRAVTGYSWEQLVLIVSDMTGDPDFARRMQADNARAQAEHRVQGKHHEHSPLRRNDDGSGGGNSRDYLLRRLAREAPAVLAAYERGEFKSVRAAAKTVGLIKEPTPLEQMRRLWSKLSPTERDEVKGWSS